jgi:hypothetical protein
MTNAPNDKSCSDDLDAKSVSSAFPIRRLCIATTKRPVRATAAANRTSSALSRFLADCITSTSSRLAVPDRIFADHNWSRSISVH